VRAVIQGVRCDHLGERESERGERGGEEGGGREKFSIYYYLYLSLFLFSLTLSFPLFLISLSLSRCHIFWARQAASSKMQLNFKDTRIALNDFWKFAIRKIRMWEIYNTPVGSGERGRCDFNLRLNARCRLSLLLRFKETLSKISWTPSASGRESWPQHASKVPNQSTLG
jgi:hypothetical protein